MSLEAIQRFAVEWGEIRPGQGAPNSRAAEVISVREFVGRIGNNVDGINFLDIQSYLENSKVPAIYVSQILY